MNGQDSMLEVTHPSAGVVGEPVNRSRHKWRRWLLRGTAGFLVALILFIAWLAFTAPLSKSLEPIAAPQITLLAADGTPIARKGAIVEAPVKVVELPDHVTHALLAIEDRRFYNHWGVDPVGVGRAVWIKLTTGRTQGGSTITQQLAKFTFLTPERSLGRKAREALIALWLETWLTKDEILERYLSNAYFGDNTYGLRAASLHYFYRQPDRLTVGQAAMLAGILQAPSRLAPSKNLSLAERRMRLVLSTMVDAGYLSDAEADAIKTPRLDIRGGSELPTGTYFADWAMPQVRDQSEVSYARQTVTTTLDAGLQAAARRAIAAPELGDAQVALVAMRRNGEVVAMVGGKNYARSAFNRVTQAKRQPGSTFKLFVYLAALKSGWKPGDQIANSPIQTGSYRPRNYGDRYTPVLTLEDAFAQSSNVAAVRLIGKVGSTKVIKVARDLGVTAPLVANDPSVALGTSSITILELTAAYAGFAGNSYPVAPTALPTKKQGWIERLLNGSNSFDSDVHGEMEVLLRRVIERGTGRAAALQRPAFGKTGTSQNNRDALFVGYAGDLVVGVWVGNDDNLPLTGVTGGGLPARIWNTFMRQALGKSTLLVPKGNPDGSIRPQDVPDVSDIPVGHASRVRIENGRAIISTEIDGRTIDLKVDLRGGSISGDRIDQEIERERQLRDEDYRRLWERRREAGVKASEREREDAKKAAEREREDRKKRAERLRREAEIERGN